MKVDLAVLKAMPVKERFDLIEHIWESLLDEPDVIPFLDSYLADYEERLIRLGCTPTAEAGWAVLKRLRARREATRDAALNG